jgi:hypothetical protein
MSIGSRSVKGPFPSHWALLPPATTPAARVLTSEETTHNRLLIAVDVSEAALPLFPRGLDRNQGASQASAELLHRSWPRRKSYYVPSAFVSFFTVRYRRIFSASVLPCQDSDVRVVHPTCHKVFILVLHMYDRFAPNNIL